MCASDLTIINYIQDTRIAAKAIHSNYSLMLDHLCDYVDMKLPAHFPVPAIPLDVHFMPDEPWMNDVVYIDSLQFGEEDPIQVCMWDFDWDRAMDFGYPHATYLRYPDDFPDYHPTEPADHPNECSCTICQLGLL